MVSGTVALVTSAAARQSRTPPDGESTRYSADSPGFVPGGQFLLGGTDHVSQQMALRSVPARIKPRLVDCFGPCEGGANAGNQG